MSVLTFVTGASSNHYKSLIQFINSYNNYSKNNRLVIYNLGFSTIEWNNLQENFPKFTYEVFDYSKYPDHVNLKKYYGNNCSYAWKPIIIYNTCQKYGGKVIWMDSGNIIHNTTSIFDTLLDKSYIYSPVSAHDIKKWTHPSTMRIMNYNYALEYQNRNGACFAFNYNVDWVKEFVKQFYEFSLLKECITPVNSDRTNHRQDQAVFTLLYYMYYHKYKFNIVNIYINFTIHNDVD